MSEPHQRFVGDGYSFCVVKGVIYPLYESGEYDEISPRMKVKEAVGFLKKQLVPTLRLKKAVDAILSERDKFDNESMVIRSRMERRISKLREQIDITRKQLDAFNVSRPSKREPIVHRLVKAKGAQFKCGALRDSQKNLKIRFDENVKNVCVGCNEIPLALARQLAKKIAKL